MINTTKKINLVQLDAELNAGGLNMATTDGTHTIWAVNEKITDKQLQDAINAHVALPTDAEKAELAKEVAQAKLAALGLTTDDLKALGL